MSFQMTSVPWNCLSSLRFYILWQVVPPVSVSSTHLLELLRDCEIWSEKICVYAWDKTDPENIAYRITICSF